MQVKKKRGKNQLGGGGGGWICLRLFYGILNVALLCWLSI